MSRAPQTPKRLKTSIRFDSMNPSDYLRYDFRFACEDCSHFNPETTKCTLGYETKWHLRDFQKKSYDLTGKMALCRFLEID
jgi:hypothetical protein